MPVNSFADYYLSWKPEKAALRRPYYLSIAEKLEADILNGKLPPGTKLPPQRELADYLDLNFTTVTRAYKICENKNLIYGVKGSGTFVQPSAILPLLNSRETFAGRGIEMGLIASFEECNEMVVPALRRAVKRNYLEHMLSYDDPTGMPHQKAAALNWMSRFGLRAEEEQVVIASGTLNAITLALLALFEPGDRIAVDRFVYNNFIDLAKLLHLQLLPVAGDGLGMLPRELDYLCRHSRVRGIFLMPSCCNPTTVFTPMTRKEELASVIKKHGLILLEDDIYAFITAGVISEYGLPLRELLPEQTLYLCGTSKSLCSGLRVAYLVFPPLFREKIYRALFNINVKTSSLDAEVVTELIRSNETEGIIRRKMALAQEAGRLFSRYFPHAQNGHPFSFFRWLPLPDDKSAEETEAELLKEGVRVFHSGRFSCGKNDVGGFLRLSLASAASMRELEEGLRIIAAYMR